MRYLITLLLLFFYGNIAAQSFTTAPAFPLSDQPLTLSVDVSGTSLEGYSEDVWLWTWLPECSANCDAPTNVNPATVAQDNAKMSRSGSDPNLYSITFVPTIFFDKSASEIERIGFKLKSVDWADNIQTDMDLFLNIASGELELSFISPSTDYVFVNQGEDINISAVSSTSATLSLSIDGAEVTTNSGSTLNYTHTINDLGTVEVTITASDGNTSVSDSFNYIVRQPTVNEQLPNGVSKGINYKAGGTAVILALEAPNKSSVYVIGEFNDWIPSTNYKMKKDSELFWLEVSGLQPSQEYAFQYLVDESIKIADPYTDKILDPDNDAFISVTTYPNLKTYPTKAEGIVSVLQTAQDEYNWQITDFTPVPKEELVIYELLVRDFGQEQNYQSILDRLDYLQDLGVNALELMPIMEFDGNLSWGYNPSFFFAPDKYYGSKNALKSFIDICHSRGMAVLLDIVLNHTHEDNPLAQLYWDQETFKPAANNPWLNQEPRHPFNVFYDFNHESTYTQSFVDSVNHYWLSEYNIDGYRFDLTKGFTQDFTESSDVGVWSSYNQKRVDLLKRMVDEIWIDNPDAYIIFEHLADNSEEKVLADHGIMLWGNMNYNFNQLTLGYADNSAVDWAYYQSRNWDEPNLIAYMESHDEERLVFRNLEFGNTANGGHNTKHLEVALDRVKAASAIYYGIPGPKMIWQFGELGYDKSIELNGRTGEKPIPWASSSDELNYDEELYRLKLYEVMAELADLKLAYDVFNTTNFSLNESQELVKQIILKNENYTISPISTDQMNVVICGNFNVNEKEIGVNFPHEGSWYQYFTNGTEIIVEGSETNIIFGPGEFRIYTDVKLDAVAPELTGYGQPMAPSDLKASEMGVGEISLSWQDNSNIENIYRIYRANSSRSFEILKTVARNTESFIDDEIMANTSYTYRVEAVNMHYASVSNEVEIISSNTITAVEIDDNLKKMAIYPNPTSGILKIEGYSRPYSIKIFKLTGEEVLSIDNHNQENLQLEELKEGIYILQLQNQKSVVKQRLIKEKQ